MESRAITALCGWGLSDTAARNVWAAARSDWRMVPELPDHLFGTNELAAKVRAAFQLVDSLKQATLVSMPYVVDDPERVLEIVRTIYAPTQEHVIVLLLDTQNCVMGWDVVYKGTVDSVGFRNAEVLRPAVLVNAPRMIVVHNHPSAATPFPSTVDREIITQLIDAAALLSIEVIDFVVTGQGDGFFSLSTYAQHHRHGVSP